jgi:hypothetical protein
MRGTFLRIKISANGQADVTCIMTINKSIMRYTHYCVYTGGHGMNNSIVENCSNTRDHGLIYFAGTGDFN